MVNSSGIENCSLLQLPRIQNLAGNITAIEGLNHLPFEVKRVFYLYDIPAGESRGAHSHKTCHQLLVAATGSFDVMLDDGKNQKVVSLNRPFIGLHIPPGIWAHEFNFSSGAICLVLTSHLFDPDDYIRDYQQYLNY
jgi:hypothetical protein